MKAMISIEKNTSALKNLLSMKVFYDVVRECFLAGLYLKLMKFFKCKIVSKILWKFYSLIFGILYVL